MVTREVTGVSLFQSSTWSNKRSSTRSITIVLITDVENSH